MIRPIHGVCGAIVLIGAAMAVQPAAAVTIKECSTLYQAAKKDGSLKGMSYQDFRKAKCSAATTATPAAATTSAKTAPAAATKHRAAVGNAVFPKAVSPKYTKESAGKARMHTCLDQYNANKSGGGAGNGGMKWIQKGGGYYSECNKHLKG